MTKSAFRCVQIVLLFYGVFGADEDEVKAVSVMEGDSVTLNPDLTQIQGFNLLEWRFGDSVIAEADENDISYPSYTEIFRDRLQLDQTGSLTIKNMKTKHAGLYELKIRHGDGNAERKFNVTVYESPSVIDAGKAEMTSESVKEGDPVTLQTGVTQISGDELIVWRFGEEGKLIAKADKEAKSSPLYYDERFRDRLELELDPTGSLIITNTRSTDSGLYSVKITGSRTRTVYKRFTVSVTVTVIERGLSPGAVAGIVLVFLAAVVAAAAAGFIYYRRKISELQKLPVTVKEGDVFTLKPNKTIQKCDGILWMFEYEEQQTSIAKFIGETGQFVTHDYAADGRFRGRLYLDTTTGSLIISKSSTAHSGLYTLYITSSSGDSLQRFIVTVKVPVPVKVTGTEGEYITLKPNKTIQKGDGILWMFGEGERQTSIAEFIGETGQFVTHDDPADWRFRDTLVLDETTGSLTIRNSRPEHSGLYTLYITSSSGDSLQRFIVTVSERVEEISVDEGGSVTLKPDTEIQRDEQIQWMFGDQYHLVAQIRGGTVEICDDVLDGRFRDRLKLEKTGSLTITNITPEHTGPYELYISSRGTLCKRFRVYMQLNHVFVTERKSVHLSAERPKIERDDEIEWMFGDEIIAEIKGGTGETHDGADGRFRDRLQLNDQTGDLTIKSFTAEHTGYYNLKICSSKGNTNRTYSVTIRDKPREKSLMKGNNGKRVDESAVEIPLLDK